MSGELTAFFQNARLDIEEFVDKKVFLEIRAKVLKDWRDDSKKLKQFGYN